MKKVFKYLIISFVFASFFQSALEINNNYISNSFDDEYDTYIHSKVTSSHIVVKTDYQTFFALFPETNFELQSPVNKLSSTEPLNKVTITHEEKLFLKNCSLLI